MLYLFKGVQYTVISVKKQIPYWTKLPKYPGNRTQVIR